MLRNVTLNLSNLIYYQISTFKTFKLIAILTAVSDQIKMMTGGEDRHGIVLKIK